MAEARKAPASLWCVVLAAGSSVRLGRSKQLVRYRGKTLLGHALSLAERAAPGRVIVVLGADARRLRALVRRSAGARARTVFNPSWRSGMASSLVSGLRSLPGRAEAAVILLTDQPRLEHRSIARLVARWSPRRPRPVAASYSGRVGVPAVLPRRLWREACRLEGDVGARALLRNRRGIVTVDLPEARTDIDTPADIAALGTG